MKKVSDKEVERFRHHRRAGWSYRKIAKKFNYHPKTIWYWIGRKS